jgi:predicted MFS family arabinose efflux permease
MLLLDVTVVNVALPAIRRDLGASFAELQWVILTDEAGWRWVFLVNLPIGALLIWLTARSLPESRDDRPRPVDVAGMVSFGAACFLATYGLIRGNADGWGSTLIVGSLAAAAALAIVFVVIESRGEAPMLPLSLFKIPAFTGTALVAFAQSVALYPLLLFMAIYLQDGLGLSPTETGLRLLPLTLVLAAVAPISGRLTGRLPLRIPLATGLVLIGVALLLMRAIDAHSDWTALLPGLLVGGLAVGVISPALAAAMVSVLPVERSGLASGINNTFRQLGIAIGIAGLGALFEHNATGAPSLLVGIVDGLEAVLLVAAVVALLAAVVAWPLLGSQRSSPTGAI